MTYRKKFTITLSTLLIPIFLVIVGMVIIDPYFAYHKPIDGIPYTLEEGAYINAGILKNFDYDSVIIGSSLAALMEPSIVDEKLGANTVKTTISGASTRNGAFLMEYALNNKKICNIIYSLDYNALLGDKSQLDRALPQYLYDKNPFNDLQYILNKQFGLMEYLLYSTGTEKLRLSQTLMKLMDLTSMCNFQELRLYRICRKDSFRIIWMLRLRNIPARMITLMR